VIKIYIAQHGISARAEATFHHSNLKKYRKRRNVWYAETLLAIPLRSIANNARGYLRCHTPFRSAELRITADMRFNSCRASAQIANATSHIIKR